MQASGKKRLILNLRKVNQCLYKQKFKFEDYKHALAYFWPSCFFTKFDLKSGYRHVEIFPDHRKYVGFSWKFHNGQTRYFMFNVLLFGLSTAPYIFTKLFPALVKLWRSRGFHPVVYLDDGLNIEDSLEQAHTASHQTRGGTLNSRSMTIVALNYSFRTPTWRSLTKNIVLQQNNLFRRE